VLRACSQRGSDGLSITRARLQELERGNATPERFGELSPLTLHWLAHLRDEGPKPEGERRPLADLSSFTAETQALMRELRGP